MELRSPIRLFWDITPLPEPLPDYRRIAAEIASSRVLALQVTDLSAELRPATVEALRRLSGSGIAISLTVAATALPGALSLLNAGITKLYVDLPSPDGLNSFGDMKGYGVSFRPSSDAIEILPDLIGACLDHGIPDLVLPMERLISGELPLCLNRTQQELLSRRLTAIPFNGRITITIHDPFLWRAFYPDTPFPDGSCQAGNTMLAIDPSGNVYPCPAMPFRLGSLLEKHFREIVASEDKRATRILINSTPSDCTTCRLFPGCRGGCRGRSYLVRKEWNTPDPACGLAE